MYYNERTLIDTFYKFWNENIKTYDSTPNLSFFINVFTYFYEPVCQRACDICINNGFFEFKVGNKVLAKRKDIEYPVNILDTYMPQSNPFYSRSELKYSPLEADLDVNNETYYIWTKKYNNQRFPIAVLIVPFFALFYGKLPTFVQFSLIYEKTFLQETNNDFDYETLKENHREKVKEILSNTTMKTFYVNGEKFPYQDKKMEFKPAFAHSLRNIPCNVFLKSQIYSRLYKMYASATRDICTPLEIGKENLIDIYYAISYDLQGIDFYIKAKNIDSDWCPVYAFCKTIVAENARRDKEVTRHHSTYDFGIELVKNLASNPNMLIDKATMYKMLKYVLMNKDTYKEGFYNRENSNIIQIFY